MNGLGELSHGPWPTHHPASLGLRHHSTTSYSSLDDKAAVVCKKNVFVSKSMRVQLTRVSYINMVLVAQTVLFNAYRGEAITHSATCESYNTVRLLLRSVLWGTSFVLFLPTTGHKLFKLYHVRYDCASKRKRHRLSDTQIDTDTSQPPSRKQLHVVRTSFLRLCEVVALAQIVLLALTIVYIPLGMVQPSWTWDCPSDIHATLHGLLISLSFVFALWAYIATWDFLVMFHQLRTHLLLQHGVFGDAHLAHDRPFNRSRTEILRHRMWVAVQEKDMEALHAAVTKALAIDPAFATSWFPGATLQCHKRFARSQHNPLHLALKTHQHEMTCYLLDVGFGLNTLEKVQLSEFALRHVYDKVFCFFSPNFEEPPSLYGPRGWFKHTLLTPLHVAVARSDVPMVQKLLASGADPNVPAQSTLPTYATPPLFWATHPDVTKLLLEHGANQLHVPKHGFYLTAYEDALLHGRHAIAHLMETWGADIALTPLHDAAAQGDPDLLLPFLSEKSVNTLGEQSKGLFRRTPLHWAAIRGKVDTARVLLQHGATINAIDAYGRTPLAWACYLNHVELAEELVTLWDAKLNSVDHLGQTIPCLCATRDGIDTRIFRLLRESGLGDFGTVANGDTPLHIAMKLGHEATAIALVRSGSSTTSVNDDGVRAIDCTSSTELQFIIKKEAGQRDVMISYSHAFQPFALRLRQSLEDNFLTTWMDLMDPTGISGGAVWRDEIANGIQNAAVVLCILSETYPASQWCMKELAFAKAHNVPVVAVMAQTTEMTDELQVYLWSRQLVDFRPAIVSASPTNGRSLIVDDVIYSQQLASLLDGLRNEVEKHRVDDKVVSRPKLLHRLQSQRLTSFESMHAKFVFISHGNCHLSFARRLQTALWDQGAIAYIENRHEGISINDAILKCEAFIPIFSASSCASDVFSDQLAFAENREKRIVPVLFSPNFFRLAHSYSLSLHKSVVHFNEAIGFQESLDHLFAAFPWASSWLVIHSATSEDADSLVDDAPMLEYHMYNLVL